MLKKFFFLLSLIAISNFAYGQQRKIFSINGAVFCQNTCNKTLEGYVGQLIVNPGEISIFHKEVAQLRTFKVHKILKEKSTKNRYTAKFLVHDENNRELRILINFNGKKGNMYIKDHGFLAWTINLKENAENTPEINI